MKSQKPPWLAYYSDTIHVSNPESEIAIVCLWTKKERVIEKLEPSLYAYIGQLYSREYGVGILIRNLLADNHIRHLIVTGVDLNNSSEGLINFFRDGVDDENRIVGTDINLDRHITKKHATLIRERVKLHDLRSANNFSSLNKYMKRLPKLGISSESIVLPLPDITPPTRFPTDYSGFKVRGADFSSAYSQLLTSILRFGYFDHTKKILLLPNVMIFIKRFTDEEKKYLSTRKGKRLKKISATEIGPDSYSSYHVKDIDAWQDMDKAAKALAANDERNICIMASYAYIPEEFLEDAIEATDIEQSAKWDPDPNGNLVIRVEDGLIKVTHVSQKGKTLEELSGKTAKQLYRKLAAESRVSMLYHAFDIGAELQKAEIALREGKRYVQDRDA